MDNNKMYLREINCCDIDWIYLAQDRGQWRALVNTVMNLRVPYNAGKFLSSCITGFGRNVDNLSCMNYFSCFSYRRPILNRTNHKASQPTDVTTN
jgi:hypothetical protein